MDALKVGRVTAELKSDNLTPAFSRNFIRTRNPLDDETGPEWTVALADNILIGLNCHYVGWQFPDRFLLFCRKAGDALKLSRE